MKSKIAYLPLLLLLTGCATVWVNPNKSTQDFHRDNSRCQVQAGQACGSGQYSGFCRPGVFDSCMLGEGWAKQQ